MTNLEPEEHLAINMLEKTSTFLLFPAMHLKDTDHFKRGAREGMDTRYVSIASLELVSRQHSFSATPFHPVGKTVGTRATLAKVTTELHNA